MFKKLRRKLKKVGRKLGKSVKRSRLARSVRRVGRSKAFRRVGRGLRKLSRVARNPMVRALASNVPGVSSAYGAWDQARRLRRTGMGRAIRSGLRQFQALRNDARGLTPDGTKYVVESGDYAGKIAEKLTGSAGRYRELISANPQKPTKQESYGPNFKTLFAGETLNLPADWQQPLPAPSPDEEDDGLDTPLPTPEQIPKLPPTLPIPPVSVPTPPTIPTPPVSVPTPPTVPVPPTLPIPPVSVPTPPTVPVPPTIPTPPVSAPTPPVSLPTPGGDTVPVTAADDDGTGVLFGVGLLGTAAAFASGLIRI